MKKLLFSLAVLISLSSFAFAQTHTDVISQVGNNNLGSVVQGGAQSNIGTIYTVGNSNDATINQLNNGFGGAGLQAYITQNGDLNHAAISQPAGGNSVAFGHLGTIDQDGNSNDADITQFDGTPSTAYIRQLGNVNDGDQVIYSDGTVAPSSAWLWQEGNNNIASQNLGNGQYITDAHFTATQVGNSNTSTQVMTGYGAFPVSGDVNTNAYTLNGTVLQDGDLNIGVQSMTGYLHTATLTQLGNSNTSTQLQSGFGHTSTVYQAGNNNVGYSDQH